MGCLTLCDPAELSSQFRSGLWLDAAGSVGFQGLDKGEKAEVK